MPLNDAWARLVDDAAIFPPGDAPLHEATAAYGARTDADGKELVGSFVLRDTDLPLVRGFGGPLSVVVTGGAGQLAGPVGLCVKLGLDLAGIEIAVRDLDDPAGNVRRVVAALREVETEVPVYVELPATPAEERLARRGRRGRGGRAAAEVRTGGLDAPAYPSAEVLAGWIDAALDRETAFKCTAGLHNAVRHTGEDGFEHHGFLNVLVATRMLFDGATSNDAVIVLEQRDAATLVSAAHDSTWPAPAAGSPPSAPARSANPGRSSTDGTGLMSSTCLPCGGFETGADRLPQPPGSLVEEGALRPSRKLASRGWDRP